MWKKAVLLMAISTCMAGNIVAQNVVDVHCHNILPFYMDVLEEHDAAMDEGFPLPAWNVDEHLKFMEDAGIACSILTMPAPQPYFGDTEECRQTIRRYNEYCAKLKAEYPDKFRFCASLPLPDVDAAIAEKISQDMHTSLFVRVAVEIADPSTLPRTFSKSKRVVDMR